MSELALEITSGLQSASMVSCINSSNEQSIASPFTINVSSYENDNEGGRIINCLLYTSYYI